ncbi:MAG: carbamoyltransferase HypF, partial [Acidimicrobiia bacterium]|nr:carbamoyltransferase HypF [Acidimicrobiia bacterium]
MNTLVTEQFVVTGVVQGVGFRPYVYRLATELGLSGEVGNSSTDVWVTVAGSVAAIETFAHRLVAERPPLARIDTVHRVEVQNGRSPGSDPSFVIVGSHESGGPRTLVPPDTAVCVDCIAEMNDPGDRRFAHPFITCTNCGPRFTIIRDLPYDRPATAMGEFSMCAACAAEYTDPSDRRYHAQPIACHDCGPTLSFTTADGQRLDAEPIELAAQTILGGGVVAIKGLGGFHLACAANNPAAVATLRHRKHRPDKPLAVMVDCLETAQLLVHVNAHEIAQLCSPARPVVLARATPDAPIVHDVAPGNPLFGVMLPYTPIHHLLFAKGVGPLVMTSGNLHGEPIVYRDGDVVKKLGHLVDGVLTHDRAVEVPCDDSVVRMVGSDLLPIRRARGFAPLPVSFPFASSDVLAVGGELKNTFAVVTQKRAWVSQHIGDMQNLETLRAFETTSSQLMDFYRTVPEVVAVDAHPGYSTTRWARTADLAPVREIQHHWAHVAAVMAEHQLPPTTSVVGVAFDGTGYGSDGTIWGGEFLLADGNGFERLGHLAPVNLPGGDGAIRFPNRMALAHLHAAGIEWEPELAALAPLTQDERALLATQLDKRLGCVPCTSMGRLFDAVASLLDVRHEISYEAQAAIELEVLAAEAGTARHYGFGLNAGVIDPAPVLRAVVADVVAGIPIDRIAAGFHQGVAHVTAEVVSWILDRHRVDAVALTG